MCHRQGLGNETKICAMEPTLKLDAANFDDLLFQGVFYAQNSINLHGYTCCPCKFPVSANKTNDMLDSWEAVG